MSQGRLEVCEDIAAADYVEHALAPFGAHEPGRVNGPDHLKATAQWLRDQFPDMRMIVEMTVSEGDLIAVLVTSTGTNRGPLNGVLPPTGRPFSARQSHWFRVRDGRLAEHWATRDDLGAMMQLGAIAPPGRPT